MQKTRAKSTRPQDEDLEILEVKIVKDGHGNGTVLESKPEAESKFGPVLKAYRWFVRREKIWSFLYTGIFTPLYDIITDILAANEHFGYG